MRSARHSEGTWIGIQPRLFVWNPDLRVEPGVLCGKGEDSQ
ncbi:hypothetical protein HMPREF9004_0260 [Schaalia cardiffensis F0333]|uniref:Uncharacterized protein n=1 Tax=Schaalia cardiffensis F0333 TaxID=888050 RepID=N6W8N8_9ACTO|nr:hypothetical protein HMPREF9004_0260 [Schaalia cardiffensis F0333]